MPNADVVAACGAALLKACWVTQRPLSPGGHALVDLDDAAACLAQFAAAYEEQAQRCGLATPEQRLAVFYAALAATQDPT